MRIVFLATVSDVRSDPLVFRFKLIYLSRVACELVISVQKWFMGVQSQVPEKRVSAVCTQFRLCQTHLKHPVPSQVNSVDYLV